MSEIYTASNSSETTINHLINFVFYSRKEKDRRRTGSQSGKYNNFLVKPR
jgi:hypothetical protein